MKKAYLVTVSLTTRILTEANSMEELTEADGTQIAENLMDRVRNGEAMENIESFEPDTAQNEFRVMSFHEVYEDDYEHGEGRWANSFELNSSHTAGTPIEAVRAHLEAHGYSSENIGVDGNDYVLSVSVNGSNEEATAKELYEWKKGAVALYVDNMRISLHRLERIKAEL